MNRVSAETRPKKKRPGGRPPAVGKSKHQPFEKIQLAHWITDHSQ
ncbi:hypothetical protein [Azospirillum palustre]